MFTTIARPTGNSALFNLPVCSLNSIYSQKQDQQFSLTVSYRFITDQVKFLCFLDQMRCFHLNLHAFVRCLLCRLVILTFAKWLWIDSV